MNTNILSPEDYQSMPWKNGLGTTVEIAKENLPRQDTFAWRLSMADVGNDGPFSNFKGYDRTLLLLEGRGITLSHSNGHIDILDAPLQSVEFRGEAETFATLLEGPIVDFNVMVFRSRCGASVETSLGGEISLNVDADVFLVHSVSGDLNITFSSGESLQLNAKHTLIVNEVQDANVLCTGGSFISVSIIRR
ncbi:MAG: HutD family protein [Pseudomonadota bacterium]